MIDSERHLPARGPGSRASGEDPRLARIAAICQTLPEAVRVEKGAHASFLVRRKVFVYFLSNHHGDGMVSLCVKLPPGENQALIAAHPGKFYSPAYIGARGWVALRLDRGRVDWHEARDMIAMSYLLVAPRHLAARLMPRD